MAADAEGSGTDAAEIQRLRAELALEGERLEKLWEAYKAQEEDLRHALARAKDLESEIGSRDSGLATHARTLAEKDAEIARLASELSAANARGSEVERLKGEIATLDAYKDRIEALEAALARDRERLAKLFVVYEETVAERDDLVKKLGEKV